MRQIDYWTFTHKLDKVAKAKHIPIRAMFELTYRCNFNCVHCYIPPKQRQRQAKAELSTKQVFHIIDELYDLGCFTLGFTGGEIFLRKDILEILWHAKKKGFNIVILTNGSLIVKRMAERLKQFSLNKVDITLHSMKQDVFEKITRCPGSYKKVIDAIELLHERHIPLGIKNCAMGENKADLEGVAKFADEIGAMARIGAGIVPRMDGDKAPCGHSSDVIARSADEVGTTKQSQKRISGTFPGLPGYMVRAGLSRQTAGLEKPAYPKREIASLPSVARNDDIGERMTQHRRKVFKCEVGTKSLTINPQGKLKICLEIDYPKIDILKTGLKKAWQRLNKIVEDAEKDANFKCNSCDLLEFCSWCPARGWVENKSLVACDSLSRQQAIERKQGDYAHHTI